MSFRAVYFYREGTILLFVLIEYFGLEGLILLYMTECCKRGK